MRESLSQVDVATVAVTANIVHKLDVLQGAMDRTEDDDNPSGDSEHV